MKAAVFFAAGIGALRLLSPERAGSAQDWLEELSLDQAHHLVAQLAGQALSLLDLSGQRRLGELAVVAFLFAALFVVEGVGLALARRWAAYLTVAVTTSYLPVELVALWYRWTLPRAGTAVLNIVVVAYLVVQLRATASRGRTGADGFGADTGRSRG